MDVNANLPSTCPLLLLPGGSNDIKGFWEPDSSGILSLAAGEQIIVACPGPSNNLEATGLVSNVATCVSGTNFEIDGSSYSLSSLNCVHLPYHDAQSTTRTCAGGTYEIIEIGFNVETDFYKLIDVCFDPSLLNSVYSHYVVVAGIGGYESGYPRPSFIAGDFYGSVDVDTAYTRNSQQFVVGDLLGSSSLGSQYISSSSDYFLSRGHLAAKADFVFGVNQRATFWYINVAPQWQTFNGANWNTLEMNVRSFADANLLDLQVYTGTYGVTTLPNVNGVETELYLGVDSNNNKVIPVPKLYWKLVIDEASNSGVVFLGVNNPYIDNPGSDYFICTDVCSQINWVHWQASDVQNGISYCCEVSDFQRTVTVLPEISVGSLLT